LPVFPDKKYFYHTLGKKSRPVLICKKQKLELSSLRSQLIGVMGYWNNAGMGKSS